MLVIQLALVAVVVGYYSVPSVARVLEDWADFKDSLGIVSVVIVGFVAGGLLPELAKLVTGRLGKVDGKWLGDTAYTGVVYSLIALCVWTLYIFLEAWLGPTKSVGVLAAKVGFDQLVFSPLVSMPLAFHMFGWRDAKFKAGYLKNLFDREFYVEHVAPPLVMCWAYWGPVVSCIYLFPERLQFVIAAFCQGAWSLLFVLMVRGSLEPKVVH